MKTGIELIAEERQRQVNEEGWKFQHDDEHYEGELVMAGKSYYQAAKHEDPSTLTAPKNWPWDEKWWKPSTKLRCLVKAGALYQAEIDREYRAYYPSLRTIGQYRRQINKIAAEIDRLQNSIQRECIKPE